MRGVSVGFLGVLCLCCMSHARRPLSAEKFLDAERAKASLSTPHRRRKRGWLFDGSEENGRIQKEVQEDLNEMQRLNVEIDCRNKCWDDWSEWGQCDGKCNSGVRRRTRNKRPPVHCRKYPCPGAAVESQKCHMTCGRGGTIKNGNCKCSTGYVGQCCEKPIECAKPPLPANGDVEGDPKWPRIYGEVIVYKCNKGYGLDGPQQRKCLLSGKWEGTDPKCDRIKCPAVPSPANGNLLNEEKEYFYSQTVGYQCTVGYELHGVHNRKCVPGKGGKGEWTASEPECRPRMCGNPGTPRDGSRVGDVFTYGGKVIFKCKRGYQMIGNEKRECLETGTWSGSQPICKKILCDVPERPQNCEMSGKISDVDSTITFTCHRGYELIGPSEITCLQNGTWDGDAPECQAIGCGDPGKPINGTRYDEGFGLGQVVNFTCFKGYLLDGARETVCQPDKKWSSSPPKCIACDMGYYKTGADDGGSCQRCPDNSHTNNKASYSPSHCICNHGYKGPPGGECKPVRCERPKAPAHGRIGDCGQGLGDVCLYHCDDGYILQKGSSVRTCTVDSKWDGDQPQCLPCDQNTYKASPGSCLPCPRNSFTSGKAKMRNGCKCAKGYSGPPGGPCVDVNECMTPNGLGPCQQACNNRDGSYACDCVIPGYKLQKDKHTCYVAKQCTNLTESDAPGNGGLVCHWYNEENSQQCQVKCDPGYEMPERTNEYETCGPVTEYQWSFRMLDPEAELSPCIEEFFPTYRFEGDSAYFVQACKELNSTEQAEVKRTFANLLTKRGICMRRRHRVCDMQNVGIICGKTRRKRGLRTIEIDTMDIGFHIVAKRREIKLSECEKKICPMIRIPRRYCIKYCLPMYKRFLRAAVMYAHNQINQLYAKDKNSLNFTVALRQFIPQDRVAALTDVLADCDPGMQSIKGACVPCLPGTFHSVSENKCLNCSAGWYQKNYMSSACVKCPAGFTTNKPGATKCEPCPSGKFGVGCDDDCECVHGRCDPVDGTCACSTGWEGRFCEKDIEGCKDAACFRGVNCVDVTAPGLGYKCGPCPRGFHGDGMVCRKSS